MRHWLFTIVWFFFLAAIIFLADADYARGLFDAIQRIPAGDKAGHFLLIGLMAFFLNLALRNRTFPLLGRKWLLGSAIVVTLAAAEECSQLWLPHRTFDLGDLAADVAGVWCFGWVARRILQSANNFDSSRIPPFSSSSP